MKERLFILSQYLLPHHLLSRLAGCTVFRPKCNSPSSASRLLRIVRDVEPRGSLGIHQP